MRSRQHFNTIHSLNRKVKVWAGITAGMIAVMAVMAIGFTLLPHSITNTVTQTPTAHAQSFGATTTVVFGLNVYGYSAKVTGLSNQQIFSGGPITDASGYAINPSDYKSGVPHKIYLNASSFGVDFRLGLEICQPDGTNCHQGWTPWASQIANGTVGTDIYSPIIGGGPLDGGSKCGAPTATLHNRLGDIFLGAETRPLPAGTVLKNVTVTLFPLEYDFNVPVNKAMNPTCWNPYMDSTNVPGTTPIGGGWSNGAFDKWNNASTDGFMLEINAGKTTYDAQPVSSTIPTTVTPSQTLTTGTGGAPLAITMKNTGTSFWPSTRTGTTQGQSSGTCQVSTNGDGVLNAPASTTANYGASCTVNYVYAGTLDALSHTKGSFTPSPNLMQYTKIVPVTTTWVAPTSTTVTECTSGGRIQQAPAAFRGGPGLVSTAYAAALPVGASGPQCFQRTVIAPAHYESHMNGSSGVGPGQTAQFILNSLKAPSQTGSYTETWQMSQSNTSFGTPFSTTIQVGKAGGAAKVSSINGMTQKSVASSWKIFGAKTISVTSQLQNTTSGLPDGSWTLSPSPNSAGTQYALGGVRKVELPANQNNGGSIATLLKSAFSPSSALAAQWCNPSQVASSGGVQACKGGNEPTQSITPNNNTVAWTILWYPVAQMSVSPSSVTLTSASPTGQVKVSNTSSAQGSELSWQATTTYTNGSGWLTISPMSDMTGVPSGGSDTVNLKANPAGLAPGVYKANVDFTGQSLTSSNNNPNITSKSVSVSFVVSQPSPVKSVSINVTPNQLTPGGSAQAVGTVTLANGSTNHDVTYSSDNSAIATVNAKTGAVVAHAVGTANIKATANASSSMFATQEVVVSNNPSGGSTNGGGSTGVTVSVTAVPTIISHSETATCSAKVTGTSNTEVTWNATDGAISGSGSTVTLSPSSASTATCAATSAADPSASGSATVTVTNSTKPLNQPSCTISASPTSVIVPQTTALTYSCKHVSSCTLSGGQFSNGQTSTPIILKSTNPNGTATASPTQDTTYTISCMGTNTYSSVNASDSVSVTVSNPGRSETNP